MILADRARHLFGIPPYLIHCTSAKGYVNHAGYPRDAAFSQSSTNAKGRIAWVHYAAELFAQY